MTNLHERKRWLVLLVLPVLVLAVALNVVLPSVALAKSHVAEGGNPGGGEGDPEEWGSPRQSSTFFTSPPRYQVEISFWRVLLTSIFRWTWWA